MYTNKKLDQLFDFYKFHKLMNFVLSYLIICCEPMNFNIPISIIEIYPYTSIFHTLLGILKLVILMS